MKNKRNKIVNLFRTGIILFVVSLLLWNCQNQDEYIQDDNQNLKYIEEAQNYFNNLSLTEYQEKLLSFSENINWNNSQVFKKENNVVVEVFLKSKKDQLLNSNENAIINFHNRILFVFDKENQIAYNFVVVISSSNSLSFISNKENINYSNISKEFSGSIIIIDKKNNYFTNNYVSGLLQQSSSSLYARVEPQERCYQIVEKFSDGSVRIIPNTRFCLGYNNDNNYKGGYHGGGRNGSGNNSADDDKIINNLTGKAKCVYEKMVDSKGNINWILKNFKDGNKPSQFDLKFVMGTFKTPETNANTSKSGNTFVIKINKNTLSERTSLGLARTIIHEAIHARLREFASRKGSNATSFPGVYNYFRIYKKNWDHQQMADFYRTTIANGLKQFDKGNHSGQFYRDMAWEGLANIIDANNKPNQIYTEAWKKLTPTEQNRIKNTIANEKRNGNKTCQ